MLLSCLNPSITTFRIKYKGLVLLSSTSLAINTTLTSLLCYQVSTWTGVSSFHLLKALGISIIYYWVIITPKLTTCFIFFMGSLVWLGLLGWQVQNRLTHMTVVDWEPWFSCIDLSSSSRLGHPTYSGLRGAFEDHKSRSSKAPCRLTLKVT